ncbi:MAG: 2-C-methyl-D-erythritol 2,4-cyclodiphosphate synthase [Eubacteriales bacterium]
MRIGIGYDVHALVDDRDLIIGGVKIPFKKGLLGHSDADVLIHAIMDALLGALALGDIGRHFPDNDASYKDVNSLSILHQVYSLLKEKKYHIENIDAVIIAQRPKLAPFTDQMKANICSVLEIAMDQLNIKATTEEGLGFTGRGEGIASQAIVLINKKS